MSDQTYLTRAGLAKLQKHLEDFQRQKRRLSEEVGRAAQLGDLRENAEYTAAKEKLQQVLDRINELQWKLSHVKLTDDLPVQNGMAAVGCRITLKDLSNSKQIVYTLVGPDEADPANGHLSIASPIGKALLGQKIKSQVQVQLPAGLRSFEILSIER
ncbi:MAG: transcription elongation factor GreA [Candidatus Omnitrophica bacterium]|nr:transcription elongation factor GreA [Candidatus Omnitrophota bacterium]